ncbi:uncharacterized protein EHS24_002404 [Apiotrichum porosum]|uniref:Cytochrome P450 n=1 Tax=Apiotrichum porosum TaxID=105984 RepID=A0A427XIG2_9TREE|nr:uncharacterized protein EHS24_002404 [Apiotrichum porosum]RSH78675.1 hypothetical protein EHS24_002404 [Apiotrichum porosum]
MLNSASALVILALGAVMVAIFLHLGKQNAKNARLPPGPKPHWLNGTPIPAKAPWRYFYDQSLKYGPLVTFWIGRDPAIVCNDVETATFFMEKNGRDTADRPKVMEVFSNGKRTLLVGYNERWRRLRKGLHNPLQPNAARDLRPMQEKGAREVILDILDTPLDFQSHIQTYAATLVVHMAYGRQDRARYSDPDIQKVITASERIAVFLKPGSFRIQQFPWLRHVPGYLSQFRKWADEELNLFRKQFFEVKVKVDAKKRVEPCFATYLMAHQQEYQLNDDDVAYLLGSVFAAGSDTTSSALNICVMAAAINPEAQKRVQAELDSTVGSDHVPTFDDLDDLPVLKAFISETFRWRPVSAGGFQHRTTSELIYKDYVVPAGTIITGNHWGIHRDESYYGPNVEDFDIDRWLTPDGQTKSNMKFFQYGFGRRVCPGQHVANNSVLMNAALLLWSFDIGKTIGPDGKPIDIDTYAFTNTANIHPLPFKATFTPRSQHLAELIKESHA